MAEVDVTELLYDPDFIDPICIVHRTPTVNEFGENVLTECIVSTIGSVQPASGKTINRLPDALRLSDVSSFWVKGNIIADGTSKYPDLLVFRGRRYQVQNVQDFSNWGSGWAEGTCVAEKPSQ